MTLCDRIAFELELAGHDAIAESLWRFIYQIYDDCHKFDKYECKRKYYEPWTGLLLCVRFVLVLCKEEG